MNRLLVVFLSLALLAFGIFHVMGGSDQEATGTATTLRPSTDPVAMAALTARGPTDGAAAASVANAAAAESASAPAPAWLQPTSRTATSNPAASATRSAVAQDKIVRLSAVLDKLNRLQAQPNIDARAAAAAIAELEQINGSAVMNGVRLDALRENVEVADRIQIAANELQRLQKSSTTPSPEQAALVQSKTAELVALQSRIRHDIMQAPDAAGVRP